MFTEVLIFINPHWHNFRGRTKFYEETGVIRDVLQNHLTELLFLCIDGLGSQSERPLTRKHSFLQSVCGRERVPWPRKP